MMAVLTGTSFTVAERLAEFAVQALLDEVNLTPKPALVDQRGSGAHDDLSLELMEHSAQSLFPMFKEMAQAAEKYGTVCQALREEIGHIGRQGERQMLQVTQGINTHRGAIWSLGLMVTATALTLEKQKRLTVPDLCRLAGKIACLEDRFIPVQALTHGQKIRQQYGINGAKQQAQQGFPVIVQYGWPQLCLSRSKSISESHARLDSLLAMMSQLTDTCVIYRAGLSGLEQMQDGAKYVLASGGSSTLKGQQALQQLEHNLLAIRASAGGAADLLAALLFLDSISRMDHKILKDDQVWKY